MSQRFHFITHPNVEIRRDVAVPRWPLSALGRERMQAGLAQPWVGTVDAVFASTEQKAIDGAQILAAHLGLPVHTLEALGENDRSATGFLEPDEFERVADAFFAQPHDAVRGWERAIDAQGRIVRAVEQVARAAAAHQHIAIVAHGAVGALLWCHLAGEPISRRWDQPAGGGGHYFAFTLQPRQALSGWLRFDADVNAPATGG
jgi:broad specificity phosphatase PhoE